jgi:inactivated superfamily I helicase
MAMETAEDVLRGLEKIKIDDGDKESVARMTTMLRNLHRRTQDQFCRTAVANKHGFQAVGRIFEQTTDFEGLTAEQRKALQAYTKEQQESGGLWSRNSGNKQNKMVHHDQAQGSMGPPSWPDQMVQQQQFWGWQP